MRSAFLGSTSLLRFALRERRYKLFDDGSGHL
jgi:hypothetical protein